MSGGMWRWGTCMLLRETALCSVRYLMRGFGIEGNVVKWRVSSVKLMLFEPRWGHRRYHAHRNHVHVSISRHHSAACTPASMSADPLHSLGPSCWP
jgi:hypothetical protein